MESSLEDAEKNYVSHWKINAQQHYNDGDYHWLCSLLNNPPYHTILEIGCGAGYSTLAFLQRQFKVISIDSNHEAIESTNNLLKEQGYSVDMISEGSRNLDNADAILWCVDLIHETRKIKQLICAQGKAPINILVLCNPGGQLTTNITKQELKYLLWGGFSQEEIVENCQHERVSLLHKWAMIYASCGLALQTDIPILIVERASGNEEIHEILEQIGNETTCRKVFERFRKIKETPLGGIALNSTNSSNQESMWGAALYFPK